MRRELDKAEKARTWHKILILAIIKNCNEALRKASILEWLKKFSLSFYLLFNMKKTHRIKKPELDLASLIEIFPTESYQLSINESNASLTQWQKLPIFIGFLRFIFWQQARVNLK